ncbi:Membrane-associated lipoprotein precursor [Metamycoplasma cloacale]|uniref:Uncharacterized protein n=1 Tax=Metamycoplasma cloacale TaxID=92401 RepID=A0A2Z4LLD9_9BACT|nr:DUF31 family protein [Metamycoplasma cloacale]AWX42572.1 hypothetical protein DK849_00530 [Metamycoplasma cloacale]VEU79722.1 Membrane-associated lipoprotein precursor [Metamycoplasma cloacale]
MKKNKVNLKLLLLSGVAMASPLALIQSACDNTKKESDIEALLKKVAVELNPSIDRTAVTASSIRKENIILGYLGDATPATLELIPNDGSGVLLIKFSISLNNKTSSIREVSISGFKTLGGGDNVDVDTGGNFNPEKPKPGFNIPGRPENADTAEYRNASVEERFKFDNDALNKAYFDKLSGDLGENFKVPSSNDSLFNPDKFNGLANENKNPDFVSAFYKNWSLPTREDEKLVVSPLGETIKTAYWDIKRYNGLIDRGLPRYIPNDKYKDILLQSFIISFFNQNPLLERDRKNGSNKVSYGTGWIIDYQKRDDGQYPTKWYIATNLHVALGLIKNQNNSNAMFTNAPKIEEENQAYREIEAKLSAAEEKYYKLQAKVEENPNNDTFKKQLNEVLIEYNVYFKAFKKLEVNGETQNVHLLHYNEDTPLNQELQISTKDSHVDIFRFKPSQVNLIYAGINFLNSNPNEYISNISREGFSNFSELQEMADFAVLEFDFEKPEGNYEFSNNAVENPIHVESASKLAEFATSQFANWDESRKFKLANFDLNEKYTELLNEKMSYTYKGKEFQTSKINLDFLALGFPVSNSDYNIKKDNLNEQDIVNLQFASSPWINKRNDIQSYLGDGLGLTQSLGSRIFIDKPGITDILLTNASLNSKTGFIVHNLKEKLSPYQGNEYLNYGLGFSLKSWSPLNGASGSSIRNLDNQILGINFAAEGGGNAGTSLIQSLRSSGHNYNKTFGKYNLEQYDLVYGGGRNQRNSYREALAEYYKNQNISTYLFGNNLGEIPEEYRFKN